MNLLLKLCFLFSVGSTFGWVLELFFRHYFSPSNPEHKWINPGFMVGPYVPLYGFGLCILYLLASCARFFDFAGPVGSQALLLLTMAACMTAIEYIAGILGLKVLHVRLWDYRRRWGNIQGLICPLFSLIWGLFGALHYYLVHPWILHLVEWLAQNLAFSFFIGVFFGVFAIDFAYSTHLVMRIRQFAADNDVVVRYERLKSYLHHAREERREKLHFLLPFHALAENIPGYLDHLRAQQEKLEHLRRKK